MDAQRELGARQVVKPEFDNSETTRSVGWTKL